MVISTGDRRRRPPTRRRPARRRRGRHGRIVRLAGLVVVAAATVALAAGAFGSGGGHPASALGGEQGAVLAADGPPSLEALATSAGGVQIDVPVSQARITAVVYHTVGDSSTVPLIPIGRQLDAGLLTTISNLLSGSGSQPGLGYYIDGAGSGPSTGSVDVGAIAGTGVYTPVTGRVVGVQPYVLNGRAYGQMIQIQPTAAPAYVVTVTNLEAVPALAVGDQVTAASTLIGHVADLSRVMSQVVSNYTSDAGNHVHLQLGRTPASAPVL